MHDQAQLDKMRQQLNGEDIKRIDDFIANFKPLPYWFCPAKEMDVPASLMDSASQKESRFEERHLLSDHMQMMIGIPPKYAVAQVIGYIRWKSAIHLARAYGGRKQNFVGQQLRQGCG
jgi:hypothetical protein